MAGRIRALYQIRVTLREIHPPVWRRIQVWEDITLARLHTILQIVMDWEDYHIHEFRIGRRIYGVPDPDDELYEREVLDDSKERLAYVAPRVGTQFAYVYDFGDNWRHDLLLEAILLPEAGMPYPVCTAGERRTPPEDVGGAFAYQRYLEVLADPDHEDHEQLLEWRGYCGAETFPLAEVNQRLQKRFRFRKPVPVEGSA